MSLHLVAWNRQTSLHYHPHSGDSGHCSKMNLLPHSTLSGSSYESLSHHVLRNMGEEVSHSALCW